MSAQAEPVQGNDTDGGCRCCGEPVADGNTPVVHDGEGFAYHAERPGCAEAADTAAAPGWTVDAYSVALADPWVETVEAATFADALSVCRDKRAELREEGLRRLADEDKPFSSMATPLTRDDCEPWFDVRSNLLVAADGTEDPAGESKYAVQVNTHGDGQAYWRPETGDDPPPRWIEDALDDAGVQRRRTWPQTPTTAAHDRPAGPSL